MRGQAKLGQLGRPHSPRDLRGEIRRPVAALHFRLGIEEPLDHLGAGGGNEQAEIDILVHGGERLQTVAPDARRS